MMVPSVESVFSRPCTLSPPHLLHHPTTSIPSTPAFLHPPHSHPLTHPLQARHHKFRRCVGVFEGGNVLVKARDKRV